MINNMLIATRKQKNWSQVKAATELGIDLRTYQRWERSESIPQPYYRERLCIIFGLPLKDLGYNFTPSIPEMATENTSFVLDLIPEDDKRDWSTWFGIRLAKIIGIVSRWNGQLFCEEVQDLINQEICVMDETLAQHKAIEEQAISRRQALATIAALPLTLMNFRSSALADTAAQEFLAHSAASITACWHLLRGNGLITVNEILPQFTPLLRTMAQFPSKYQQSAAKLAAQTSIQQALIAMHHLQPAHRETHCRDAVRYAAIAKDSSLHAAALTYLAYTYSFCYIPRQPEKAIAVFKEALQVIDAETPLLKSDILMGLADAYAQNNEEHQALHFIEEAKAAFPTYPEQDPTSIFGYTNLHVLFQWEGKMYLELAEHSQNRNHQKKAGEILTQSRAEQSITELSRAETLIYHADAARILIDLHSYTAALYEAAIIGLQLHSPKRYTEARSVFKRTPDIWAHEPTILSLAKEVFNPALERKYHV